MTPPNSRVERRGRSGRTAAGTAVPAHDAATSLRDSEAGFVLVSRDSPRPRACASSSFSAQLLLGRFVMRAWLPPGLLELLDAWHPIVSWLRKSRCREVREGLAPEQSNSSSRSLVHVARAVAGDLDVSISARLIDTAWAHPSRDGRRVHRVLEEVSEAKSSAPSSRSWQRLIPLGLFRGRGIAYAFMGVRRGAGCRPVMLPPGKLSLTILQVYPFLE